MAWVVTPGNTVLHISKNDFQLIVKVYYAIIFPLDQLKTKLNFQYDQFGPLSLFFPPFGPTEFPLPLALVVNYPRAKK